jgi:16S rRNA G966 N2-methylase RsmD
MSEYDQQDLVLEDGVEYAGPVECLGKTFENDEARRAHYLTLLAAKLKDPEFRKTSGFPQGSDEAILRLSDPPYYTACPNPFLSEFLDAPEFSANATYKRAPYAVDVSEGKRHPLYEHISYHTKVPHKAIAKFIQHYTKPGDLVMDLFAGSGMTGLAAKSLEELLDEPTDEDLERDAILSDLSPYAAFMAYHFNRHVPLPTLDKLFKQVTDTHAWMYQTTDSTGVTRRINYTVWSDVFSCKNCGVDIVFFDSFVNSKTGAVNDKSTCSGCGTEVSKSNLDTRWETIYDDLLGATIRRMKQVPVLIKYFGPGKSQLEKKPDDEDLRLIQRIEETPLPAWVPIHELPHGFNTVQPKKSHGVTHVHQFFTRRNLIAISALWDVAFQAKSTRWKLEILSGFRVWTRRSIFLTKAWKQGGTGAFKPSTSGILYFPSISGERNVFANFETRIKKARKFVQNLPKANKRVVVGTNSAASINGLADNSIDYIFLDPPFGANIMYSELNALFEAWLEVYTENDVEAVQNPGQDKDLAFYTAQMRLCLAEAFRLLKPNRWITVEFHNSKNAVWHSIQDAIQAAGFIVADVSVLDKKQGTFKQYTSINSMSKDLVISAYKPSELLIEIGTLNHVQTNTVWEFVNEHLDKLPVFLNQAGQPVIIGERTPQLLVDRMIAFFVRSGVVMPISGPDFFAGLEERYPKRDGMYFLQGQVSEYDRKRTTVSELRQLDFFVSDEASATQWIRQQLQSKPQSFQDMQPQFMQQLQSWAKHEKTIELKEILELNFHEYDGSGPVPSQIHSYLSTNFKDLRKLDKEDPILKAKALDRWYVPDPNREGDLEKSRLRTLLKEFEEYRTSIARKIKEFRTEAVRAGFKHCYDEQDYQTIVDVAAKLPEQVIQEDEKLLMYYDVATMRIGS